ASIVAAPPPSDAPEHPVGTGPWRFVAWRHDDYLLFSKNPAYWGGAPAADTLGVRILPEPLTRAAEFEAGRLSVLEVPFGDSTRSCGGQGATWSCRVSRRRSRRNSSGSACAWSWWSGTPRASVRRRARARPTWCSSTGGRITLTPTTSSIRCSTAGASAPGG